MKHTLLALILILFCLPLLAAEWNQYYFRFECPDKTQLAKLTRMISIDQVHGNWVYSYANDWEWEEFSHLGYRFQILPAPSSEFPAIMALNSSQMRAWDAYPSYDTYLAMMNSFATNYPSLCQIHNLGSTPGGRAILCAKLSSNVSQHQKKPEVLFTSTMHGDELTGYMLMLRLIDTLLSQYGTNPRLTNILDNMELWISPNTNPDGTYYGGNNTVASARRANLNGIDLNRNYPNHDGSLNTGAIQPETQIMMNFANNHHFVFGANFHGGAEVVNYPWDYTTALHPDDAWFVSSSLVYANNAQANGPANYFRGLSSNGIINGAVWYMISGGRQDWMNYTGNGREVTIECSNTKMPSASTMPNYWNYNYEALISYLEQSLYGIHGEVKDAWGNPLAATITVLNHDNNYSKVQTDPSHGDFYRYLSPGAYNLRIETSGYEAQTVPVTVLANQKTPLSVTFGELPHQQTIELTAGWNLVSINVLPSSNDVATLLSAHPQITQFKSMQDCFIPGTASVYNRLLTLQPDTAYFVHTPSPVTLNITGEPVVCPDYPINLQDGWNYVPYLRQDSMNASAALASIAPYLLEIRDLSGNPDTLQASQAYWINVSAPCQLIYP